MLNYIYIPDWWFQSFFIFHFIYGMSTFPLTNSYFSRWLKPPTRSPYGCFIKTTKNCGVFQGTRARHGRCQRPGGKRSVRPENCRQSVMDMSQRFGDLPSGKQPHIYGKSPFLMGKSTLSMAIFNSQLLNYQMVKVDIKLRLFSID